MNNNGNSFGNGTEPKKGAVIKIIGVGGGGSNAVNKMMEGHSIKGIEFYVANTDIQALHDSPIPNENKIVLGENLTKGLGAGANPDIGEKSAIESSETIKRIVEGADLVFIAAGMGGGTGTGAAPILAKIAKDAGALVVGITTTPFMFEGNARSRNALEGLRKFKENVDSIIIISNDRLLAELGEFTIADSFKFSDATLKNAVRTITDLINKHSLINLDFADVKAVIKDKGLALIGTGKSSGDDAAVEAAINAIQSPILESSIEGAQFAIVNVMGSPTSLTLQQAQEAVQTIKEAANSNVDVIFGVTINEDMGEEILVSVIATGLSQTKDFKALDAAKAQQTTNTASNTQQSIKTTAERSYEESDLETFKQNKTQELQIKNLNQENNAKKEEEEDIFSGLSLLED